MPYGYLLCGRAIFRSPECSRLCACSHVRQCSHGKKTYTQTEKKKTILGLSRQTALVAAGSDAIFTGLYKLCVRFEVLVHLHESISCDDEINQQSYWPRGQLIEKQVFLVVISIEGPLLTYDTYNNGIHEIVQDCNKSEVLDFFPIHFRESKDLRVPTAQRLAQPDRGVKNKATLSFSTR
jgi:hypothetical protein